jgi:signal transduction histidine kinase
LEELGVKAGHLERVIQAEVDDERYDLQAVVGEAVTNVEDDHPNVEVRVEGEGETWIRSSPGLELVVENLVENAVEHNESMQPTVTIVIRSDGAGTTLHIEDNGTGIPDAELAVIEAGRETQLRHASGIGLWLVKWWADRAEVPLDFETGPDGTVVTLEFDGEDDASTGG